MELLIEKNTAVNVESQYEANYDNSLLNIDLVESEYEITFTSNEFKVVNDNIYIPVVGEEQAPWLTDLIDQRVTATYQTNLDGIESVTLSLNSQIALAQSAEQAYQSSIILQSDIDQQISGEINTLRVELVGAEGTVTTALATKVTPEEATAIANTAISASLNSNDLGTIGAKVGELSTAIANGDDANASRLDVVEATVNNPVSGVNATANGVVTLNSQIGITGGVPDGTGLLADVDILKKQNDGKVETFADTYQVVDGNNDLVITAEPYASWLSQENGGIDVRLGHIGDTYIEYVVLQDGTKQYVASYKFIRATVDTVSPNKTDSEGFTWALITDSATQEAFTAALNAYALADGKITTFRQPTAPTAEGEGDIWFDSDDGDRLYTWNGSSWEGTSVAIQNQWKYESNITVNNSVYKSGFGLVANYTSGSGTNSDPYNSEFWINAEKLKFTNSNQTGTDTPFSIDASGTTPKTTFNGLVDFTNTNVNGGYPGTTTINGGLITSDTVNGNKLIADTVSADRLTSTTDLSTVWAGGGLISANFNGNVNGSIGSPTQGFRLSSNAAGTASDPNIYGASIVAGKVQNTLGTNYVDLNSTGSNPFIKVGSSISINADGSGVFARSLISEPDVIASGVFDATYTTSEQVYYIPTGIFDSNWNLSGANQPYSCRFASYTGVVVYGWNPPYDPYHFGFVVSGDVYQHVGYTKVGASTDEGNYGEEYEIILKVTVKGLPYNGGNGGMYLNKYRVGWTLNRI